MAGNDDGDIPKLDWTEGKHSPPSPNMVPEAPDNVGQVIAANYKGMFRVSVKLLSGVGGEATLGGFDVASKAVKNASHFEKEPKVDHDVIAAGVMAIAQDHFEQTGESSRYRMQVFVQHKKTGAPKKPVAHFSLGGDPNNPTAAASQAEGAITDQVMRMNRELHDRQLKAMDIIARLGEAAIAGQANMFEAQMRIADARVVTDERIAHIELQKAEIDARQSTRDRGFKLLEDLVDQGMGEALAEGIKEKLTGKKSGKKSKTKKGKKDSAGTVTQKDGDKPATNKLPAAGWAPKKTALPPKSEAPEAEEIPEADWEREAELEDETAEEPEETQDMKDLPRTVRKCRKLVGTISEEQWTELADILDEDALSALRDGAGVETEERTHEIIRTLDVEYSDDKGDELLACLTKSQLGMLLQLRRAAKQAAQ